MNNSTIALARISATSVAYFALLIVPTCCEKVSGGETRKQYWVDAKLFSMEPQAPLVSYNGHGSGGVGPRGKLGLAVSNEGRQFNVSIEGRKKSGRLSIHLSVTPKNKDDNTEALENDFDLTELKPLSIDLATDDNGRLYRLNIVPSIKEHPLPKTFEVSKLSLEKWHFKGSQVILNNQDYLGEMNMGSSPIAWVDIPGLAKVEFSLLKLSKAKPIGVLADGVVRIEHENGHSLRITNVLNGTPSDVLKGGPHRVWVRWLEPTMSLEQYSEEAGLRIQSLKSKIAAGNLELPKGSIERLEQLAASDRIFEISSGIRGVRKGDVRKANTE